jgi:hypothetical protein
VRRSHEYQSTYWSAVFGSTLPPSPETGTGTRFGVWREAPYAVSIIRTTPTSGFASARTTNAIAASRGQLA